MSIDNCIKKIQAGTVQIIPTDGLIQKLKKGTSLTIKFGADPTSSDLHLGHAVVLSKLKDLQDLGHSIIFLIGDYTARIGDPSGKSKTRPMLTQEEIEQNMQTYFKQVGRILDPHKTVVRYNSEWLDALSGSDLVKLCGKVTLAQIIEREDFSTRIAEKRPVGFHELLYPLLQSYDSVVLRADVELGGTDQTFNLLLARDLQQQFGQEPQIVITMPLLEGLDGVQKMSKSLGNFVGLNESAEQAFGKLMSISDELMWRYFTILLHVQPDALVILQEQVARNECHPMELKKQMAHDIVVKFWSLQEADHAQQQFEKLFQKRDYTAAQEIVLPETDQKAIWIIDLLKSLQLISSTSDGKRLIEQGAVSIDAKNITNFKDEVVPCDGMIVKAGKHKIVKIKIKS